MTSFELTIVVASALLHAVWNAYAKNNPNPTIFLAQLGIATVVSGLPLIAYIDFAALPPSLWWVLGGSAVVHTLYQVFLGRAYETGDLSVVYPISRSTPAFVALIAVPLLDDPVSLVGGIGIAIVLAGMWLVHTNGRITPGALVTPGILFAYLTLAATVGYSLMDKIAMAQLTEPNGRVPNAVVYFYLLTTGHTVLFVPYVAMRTSRAGWMAVVRTSWGKLLLGVFASVLSYVLILEALRTASVSYVTAVRQTSVVFAALIATFLLREAPSRARIVGAVLTVAGVGLIALFS